MSEDSPIRTRRRRPNERIRIVDTLEFVLRKADGTIITNVPQPVTEEYLQRIADEEERKKGRIGQARIG